MPNNRTNRQIAVWLLAFTLYVCLAGIPPQTLASEAQAQPLRLGIFPRRTTAMTKKIFAGFATYLSKQLNTPVVLDTSHDFVSFWHNVTQQQYDIVHYNQYHYIRSHKEQGYRVILRNEEFGESTIAGAILVRKDSGIQTLQDLKGKKIVFGGGRSAMQAYITPTYLLRQAGLQSGDYFEQFALNPPKAAIAAFYHQAAAAGAGDHILELPLVKDEIDTGQMTYLAMGEPIAHLPWAVKKTMPQQLADRIQTLLSQLHTSDEGRSILQEASLTRLIPSTDSDYDPHRIIVKLVLNEDY